MDQVKPQVEQQMSRTTDTESVSSGVGGHKYADSSDHFINPYGSKDQLDRISNKGEWARSRRSSSSSSRMGDSSPNREIVQLASIKETVNAEKTTQADLESLITAKLSQCRVIFDFSCDPLSDLKYKVVFILFIALIIILDLHFILC